MEFNSDFSSRQAKFLSTNNTYNYYRIGVWLWNNSSYTNLTKFISQLKDYSTDLFYSVSIQYNRSDHKNLQKFLNIYFAK